MCRSDLKKEYPNPNIYFVQYVEDIQIKKTSKKSSERFNTTKLRHHQQQTKNSQRSVYLPLLYTSDIDLLILNRLDNHRMRLSWGLSSLGPYDSSRPGLPQSDLVCRFSPLQLKKTKKTAKNSRGILGVWFGLVWISPQTNKWKSRDI